MARMTRILFMHQTSSIGGGSYCLLNIIKRLDRQYFEPIVALQNDGPLAKELNKLNVEVVIFSQMVGIPYNRSLFRIGSISTYLRAQYSLKYFVRLLWKVKADVLYLNNMMIYHYLRIAKEAGLKTVIHIREHWPLNEHKIQLSWARKSVYAYADRLIAINHYSASIFPKKQASIVYDWIDMEDRCKYMPLGNIFGEDMTGKKVFLYMGGLQRIKGAYEVVKTFREKLKDNSYRLLVMGFTKEFSGGSIVKIIKTLMYLVGVPTYEYKVKMLAKKDPRIVCITNMYEIKDIVEQSDCMLSYFTIPHANLALAESIILGTPVIAARTEESEEYSSGGKLAFLFEMNNITDFERAIQNFINCGRHGSPSADERQKVAELFSPGKNASILNHILFDLKV